VKAVPVPEWVLAVEAGWVLSVHPDPAQAAWQYRLTQQATGDSWVCTVTATEVADGPTVVLARLQTWLLAVTRVAAREVPSDVPTRRIELE
jgi:hypothetical protein